MTERYQKLIDDLKRFDIDGNIPLIQANLNAIDINLKAFKRKQNSYWGGSNEHHVIAHHDVYDEYSEDYWDEDDPIPPEAELDGDVYTVPIPQESAAQIIFNRLFDLLTKNNRLTDELLDTWCEYFIKKGAKLSEPPDYDDDTTIHKAIRGLNEKQEKLQLQITAFQLQLHYREKLRTTIGIAMVNRTGIGQHALDWALHPNRENLRKRDYVRMMDEIVSSQ